MSTTPCVTGGIGSGRPLSARCCAALQVPPTGEHVATVADGWDSAGDRLQFIKSQTFRHSSTTNRTKRRTRRARRIRRSVGVSVLVIYLQPQVSRRARQTPPYVARHLPDRRPRERLELLRHPLRGQHLLLRAHRRRQPQPPRLDGWRSGRVMNAHGVTLSTGLRSTGRGQRSPESVLDSAGPSVGPESAFWPGGAWSRTRSNIEPDQSVK